MSVVDLAFLGIAIPIVALGAAELTVKRTIAGVLFAASLYAVQLVVSLPNVGIGPLSVFPTDIVYGLLLAAALLRLLRSEHLTWQQRIMMVFFVVGLLGIIRGVPEFGVNGAVNEGRKFIYFTGGALYLSTLAPRRELLDRIGWTWIGLSALLVVVALLRVVGVLGAGGEGFASQGRPLDSNQTLIIGQGAFIALAGYQRGLGRILGLSAAVFFAMVVLMRHRTVWILLLVCLIVYVTTHLHLAKRLVALMTVAVLVTAGLLVTVFDAGETAATEQLAQSATFVDTFDWRLEGWVALLSNRRPTEVDVVLGAPSGTGFAREVSGRIVDSSPHNWYLETYLRMGLLGLGAFLLLVGRAAFTLRHDAGRGGLLPNKVLLVLLASQLVYFLAYDPRTVQGLLFGAVLCAMGSGRVGSAAPVTKAQA